MKKIILLGLFRTGTNYTRTILELNYNVSVEYDRLGWKHGLIPTYSRHSNIVYPNLPLLVVVKDPFAVFVSWFQYIKNGKNIKSKANNFSEFLRSNVVFRNDFSKISPEYFFSNPVQMWNSVVWNHISYAQQVDGHVLHYEEILSSPKAVCTKVAEKFNFNPRNSVFVIPENLTKNMSDASNRTNDISTYCNDKKFEKTNFFLEKQYLKNFLQEDIDFVYSELSADLIDRLGYSK
jgi:hypothetical protein